MNVNIYDLAYIIGNIFMTYVLYKFMKVFYTEKITNRQIEAVSYAIYFVMITLLHIIVKIPIILMISNIGLFFVITFNYKSSIKKRVLTAFLIYLILLCVEMIVVFATGYFNLELTIRNDYKSILGIIIIRIMSYIVVLSISNYKNIRQGDIVPSIYWLCIVIIPIGTLYMLIRIFMDRNATSTSLFISTVIVLMINFATFYLYDELSKMLSEKTDKMLMAQQNKYYEKQYELIKTSINITKSIQHDFKNHLTSLYALVKEDKKEELLDYLSEATEAVEARQEIASTENITIDNIINFKLQNAKRDKINVTIDLKIPNELEVLSFDMTVILGNLLDNALNAVKKLDKDRYINIKMKYIKGRLILTIDNSYNGILNKKEGELFTTNIDKENHGIGLQNVKSVLEKYNGNIDFEYDNSNFHTIVSMYV